MGQLEKMSLEPHLLSLFLFRGAPKSHLRAEGPVGGGFAREDGSGVTSGERGQECREGTPQGQRGHQEVPGSGPE